MVNLGGGVITDLGGFVASTYKRGIDFINVPTTLLAMVDASVGGKTGVDLGSLKNQVGVFSTPKMVLIDSVLLRTLPVKELRSGWAEMLKHGLISDRAYWQLLRDTSFPPDRTLDPLIYRSVQLKNQVVSEDMEEAGPRKILNFGHTLGHAIESYYLSHSKLPALLHGEAIAIGMVTEAYLSYRLEGLPEPALQEIKEVFGNIYGTVSISESDQKAIFDLMIHDKKNTHGKINFVLLTTIGNAVWDREVPLPLLEEAFLFYVN